MIQDGVLDQNALSSLDGGREKVGSILKRNRIGRKDAFLLTLRGDGRYTLVRKEPEK